MSFVEMEVANSDAKANIVVTRILPECGGNVYQRLRFEEKLYDDDEANYKILCIRSDEGNMVRSLYIIYIQAARPNSQTT